LLADALILKVTKKKELFSDVQSKTMIQILVSCSYKEEMWNKQFKNV